MDLYKFIIFNICNFLKTAFYKKFCSFFIKNRIFYKMQFLKITFSNDYNVLLILVYNIIIIVIL
jgi:hypothetical protein